MGLGLFGGVSACSCENKTTYAQPPPPNPNPANYRVVEHHEVGDFVILKVKYPDCTNFEGEKILVFKGIERFALTSRGFLDPHFCKKSKLVARFVPTKQGCDMALRLCRMMTEEETIKEAAKRVREIKDKIRKGRDD